MIGLMSEMSNFPQFKTSVRAVSVCAEAAVGGKRAN
jgi:hypothetical protein